MSDTKTRDTIMDVLVRTGVREHHRAMILDERNIPLRQSLSLLPNPEEATKQISDALAGI